jgi:hypothetical protein
MANTFKFILEYKEYIDNIEKSDINDSYIYNEILKRTKFGKLAIIEGLIHTHPIKKSVSILKKRFPELLIEIEEDGEIFIENQPAQKINKYLPIITNLGYFISKLTINGQEWIKEYNEETKPIAFILEAKYDYEVEIPNILYHASPIRLKDKILKWGLTPKSGSKLSNHPERIYLTDDLEKAINFGNFLKEDDNEWYKNGFCVYSVKTTELSKLYSDVNFRQGGYYTLNNIKPQNIDLIKEFIFE